MTDILSAIAAENGIIESNDTTANTDTSNNDATAQAATDAARRQNNL